MTVDGFVCDLRTEAGDHSGLDLGTDAGGGGGGDGCTVSRY